MRRTELISLPPRWRHHADPERGVVATARCPVAGRTGVVPLIRLEVAPVGTSLQRWRTEVLAATAARRRYFELDDEDDYDLEGREVAYRRFGFRRGDDDLLCEQWAWLVDGRGFTLTCTVGRGDYADFCDLFEAVAATFDPDVDAVA
ncbi:MAG: hypothetical protein ABIQ15_10905 [Nocardioides sp.]